MGTFGAALSSALLPEIILAALAVVCAVLGAVRPRERPDLYRWIAVLGLLGAVTSCAYTLHATASSRSGVVIVVWNGGLAVDHLSLYITVVACAFALITCLSSDTYLRRIPSRSAAFFSLLLLVTAAISALAAEREMVTFFVTLEVVIVALTALQALVKSDDLGGEAAWKFLVEGAVASAAVLYGLAILYGITGSTSLTSVAGALSRAPATGTLGIALVLLGLTFPLGIAPLRAWVARAGEATPAAVAGFAVTMGMTAGAVAWLRFGVSGVGIGVGPWTGLTAAVAAIALAQAALIALRETRVSRLVGALASAQAALLLLAILGVGTGASGFTDAQGGTAFLFAIAVFGVSLLATFVALTILQTARLADGIDDFRGLGHRSPRAALVLAIALAALAGVPPAAGFLGRLFVLESSLDAGFGWLAAAGVAAAIVTAVPVIRLIAAMYAERGEEEAPFSMAASPRLTRVVAVAVGSAAFLATGVVQPLLLLAHGAAGPLP